MNAFVHLRVHSDYSLGTGASKVKDLVKQAKILGIPAFALTDNSNMHGALTFSKEAAGAGVQPIIGAKFWTEIPVDGDMLSGSLSLLAQDEQGYKNLCQLIERAWLPQSHADGSERPNRNGGNPTLPIGEAFKKDADLEGVIVLTGGYDGIFRRLIQAKQTEIAGECLDWLSDGLPGRLYVEICRNAPPDTVAAAEEDALFALAKDRCLPVIATTEIYYATPDRDDAFQILRAVREKGKLTLGDEAPDSPHVSYHMRSAQEMGELFSDMPEAVENAVNVAYRCAFKAGGRDPILPSYPCEAGRTENDELADQALAGLEDRFVQLAIPDDKKQQYYDRLTFEIGIIQKMGFPGYFLIVSDFMRWSIANEIPVGPGRGSGAGSLVAYALKITDLDPLRFDLLFERFLNPDRVSMPDFDIDFCQDRREEVIRYVREKYGSERVASIVTFMEEKSKSAITDVGRVLNHPTLGNFGYGELKMLSSQIPKEPGTAEPYKLAKAYSDVEPFRKMIKEGRNAARYQFLYENSLKIEGLFRNTSSHAAGIIIAGKPIRELVPTGYDDKTGLRLCQFGMKDAETSGLVKFDFLGLTTLSIIREATTHVRTFYEVPEFDVAKVELDDPAIYDLFADGQTAGIFQFESDGMVRNLKEMRPTRIEDLIAANALYRPGPMEMFPTYNSCKNGTAEPAYPEPAEKTKLVLEETFGIMVYQEQVMKIAQVVAGFTLAQADLLRRAIGKKIKSEMDAQKSKFIDGAVALGVSEAKASKLFADIEKFASYGFNKSHAAAYAVVAYRTAYLKKKFPVAFFAAQLSYESDPGKMRGIKQDMVKMGVQLLAPDINKSYKRFMPEIDADGQFVVRFGLQAVKQLSGGLDILEQIRAEGGPFKSLEDFATRAGTHFNKAQIENMVASGCFDAMDPNRARAFAMLQFLAKQPKNEPNQANLFSDEVRELVVPEAVRETKDWLNRFEREFLAVGFYFNGHPLDSYMTRLIMHGVRRRAKIEDHMRATKKTDFDQAKLVGMVENYEKKVSGNNGNQYFKVFFEEMDEKYQLIFFEREQSFAEMQAVLDSAKTNRIPVVVSPKISFNHASGEMKIWPYRVDLIDDALKEISPNLIIELDSGLWEPSGTDLQEIESLKDSGKLGGDAILIKRRELAEKAAVQDATRLIDEFERMRNDDDDRSVQVQVLFRLSGQVHTRVLSGYYNVAKGFDARLRSFSTFSKLHETAEELCA